MKPINAKELNKSYRVFSLNFLALAAFSILCVYFFFASTQYDYDLLSDNMKKSRQLLARRREINTQFDLILLRFKQLSRFTSTNSEEMNNQSVMIDEIQNANFKIKETIKQQQSTAGSFLLYKKMTDDVAQMAGIQDSLFTTRFRIESTKTQLESCLQVNHSASAALSGQLFKR
ncbi:type VI secretion system TssO [Pedobacter hartonius]|uniref:Four helix bundle sensory module for signal transduction n=1 Tax=Pedobacter hartonius TaxID=425514 RepID=A0A1H4H7S2_9SPHI|nr:type VI secretion system TssO [Pedobacter hartonius]SEB17756.1 hypothetical protein SAMN05443550_11415 [Pedobacter hartonius]